MKIYDFKFKEWAHDTKGEIKSWKLIIEPNGYTKIEYSMNKEDFEDLIATIYQEAGSHILLKNCLKSKLKT